VPDSRTVWLFRETLVAAGTLERLFAAYRDQLLAAGLITARGVADRRLVRDGAQQRNTREENAQIKQGQVPPEWSEEKRAHKDCDGPLDAQGRGDVFTVTRNT